MIRSSMKKSREYLCFTKRDDNGINKPSAGLK